jgi:hypothetical protein
MATDEDKKFLVLIAKAKQKREKRDRLQRELEETQGWLNKFDALMEQLMDQPDDIISYKSETKPAKKTSLHHEKTKPEKIREILEASDQPMKVRQIFDAYNKRYEPIPGNNGITIIRNALGKKSQWFVQNTEDKTWCLKGRDYPKKQIRDAQQLFHTEPEAHGAQ